jgi:AraC family transcriptional regulator of adaptative response/methylated-DNA-[protein]-cysteine methyltransferase
VLNSLQGTERKSVPHAVHQRRIQRSTGHVTETIRYVTGDCALGAILVATSHKGVCAILLGDRAEPLVQDLETRFADAAVETGDAATQALLARIARFVEAPAQGFDLPLDLRGTPFQQRVWQALRDIPPGATASYGAIAARIGEPRAALEVAEACAANPLAVAVPCHRVVRANGAISGYRWGVKRKRALLQREAA